MSQENGPGTYFLGRYRVVDEIGIGGMASVHLARMDGPGGFQKWVAIKRIHSHLIEDESFVQMFLDEARVAARISHPNVASVIELGKHQDSYWIAMVYLHGEPLREVMRRTEELGAPMPPEIACRIIADAAEGLHAAHELQGKDGEKLDLVHRDVTPHNLFVTYDGSTKVVDFGIAKFLTRMSNTRHGTLKGKIAYMSPEQVHGETIDRRTDLFALGVVLWELTTGKRLFRMESDLDTLAKVQECNVPKPSTIVRGYPLDLEKIVLKALAKKRDDRFRTARELSRALQGLLMRRGLFVASDEVASYMRSIFSERIQKRDAHLRWAAEVTQTINIDVGPKAETQSALLVVPDSADQKPAVPRPAAGAPARPAAPAAPMAPAIPVQSGVPSIRGAHPPTGSSQAATAPRPVTSRPPAPLKAQEASEPSEPYYEDGPTIMEDPPMEADYPVGEEEEYDDTIITTTRVEQQAAGKPLPAAGRPADMPKPVMSSQKPALPTSQRPGGTEAAPPSRAKAPEAYGQIAYEPTRPAVSESRPSIGKDPTPPPPFPAPAISQPPVPAQQPVPTTPFAPAPLSVGPAGPQMLLPTVPRVAVPAESRSRGLPVWMVAVGSGLVALVFVGVLYAVLSRPSTPHQAVRTTPPAGGGPFGAARNVFQAAITPKPLGLAPGTPTLTPTAPGSATNTATTPTAPSTPATTTVTPTPTPAPPTPATPAAGGGGGTTSTSPPTGGRPPAAAPARGMGSISVFCRRGGKGIECDEVLDNGRYLGARIQRVALPAGMHTITVRTRNPSQECTFTKRVDAEDFVSIRAYMDDCKR